MPLILLVCTSWLTPEDTIAPNIRAGTVKISPDDQPYKHSKQITLTAVPANGWRFGYWLDKTDPPPHRGETYNSNENQLSNRTKHNTQLAAVFETNPSDESVPSNKSKSILGFRGALIFALIAGIFVTIVFRGRNAFHTTNGPMFIIDLIIFAFVFGWILYLWYSNNYGT